MEKALAREYKYILLGTGYFSKWAEAIVVQNLTTITVTEFIQIHLIYRFCVPETIMADNGQPFKSAMLYKLYAKYKIKGNSSRQRIPANRLAETFNKTLCTILEKMVWQE